MKINHFYRYVKKLNKNSHKRIKNFILAKSRNFNNNYTPNLKNILNQTNFKSQSYILFGNSFNVIDININYLAIWTGIYSKVQNK